MLEASFATESCTPAQLDLYQRTANSLRRLLESVGIKRVAKDITPTDAFDYMRRRQAED